ncbi:MAG: hypothetical protein HOP20_07775 [Sulfuriferula sp.]|nr:hypothetical protein [Sulfuriferula sp.]
MLRSYEAIYDHGVVRWLGDQPVEEEMRVIVTILPKQTDGLTVKMPHQPSSRIAGKGKVLGDIVAPVSLETDWNCLK